MRWTALLETTTPQATSCCPWPEHCSCRPAPVRSRATRLAAVRVAATVSPSWEAPLGIDLGRSGDSWEEIRALLEQAEAGR